MTKKRQSAREAARDRVARPHEEAQADVDHDGTDEVRTESHAAPAGHEDEGHRHSRSPSTDEDVD